MGPSEILPTIRVRDKIKDIEVRINDGPFDEERYERLDELPTNKRAAELAVTKASELRTLAEKYGLDSGGKKADLVKAILAYEEETE